MNEIKNGVDTCMSNMAAKYKLDPQSSDLWKSMMKGMERWLKNFANENPADDHNKLSQF